MRDSSARVITFAEACERVRRFCRIVRRRKVLVHSSRELDTHWYITYAVRSLEDSTRIFQYATMIVEKLTGHLFYPPSRSAHPIDFDDFPSDRQMFVRVTIEDLEELKAKRRSHG